MSTPRPAVQWPAALGAWLVLALAIGLNFPYFEQTRNANERPRLMQAMAWVDAGEWAIDGVAARGLDAGPDTARSAVDRRLYPNKPPGTTVAAAAGYRLARAIHGDELTLRQLTAWARLIGGGLPTLLLAWLLWRRHAPAFGFGPTMAAVMLLVLATPMVAYAHLLYGHALGALLLHAGIVALADARERDGARALAHGAAAGALAGAAVAVEYMAVFAALPIGLALLGGIVRAPRGARGDALRIAVAAVAGALVPIAALARYHASVFGSPWSTGYMHSTVADFAQQHGQGLMGLTWPHWSSLQAQLLSVDAGLLWWAPVVVPGAWGLLHAARDRDRGFEARLHLGLVAVFLWLNASLVFDGGWRVGPRYFALALPSFVIGWAELLGQARRHPPMVALVVALGVYGIVVDGLAANLWPHIDVDHVDAPVSELLLPLLEGTLRPYVAPGLVTQRDLVWLVIAVSVVTFALVMLRAIEPGVRTLAALVGGTIVGIALVGMHRWLPRHPDGARNLAYVEKVWEPRGAAARSVNLRPLGGTAGRADGTHDDATPHERRRKREP